MLKKVHNFFSPSNPLLFRCKMAHKIQALEKRLDAIVKEKKDFNLVDLLGVHIPPPPVSMSRETDSYVIEEDVCGRDVDKAKIRDALINSSDHESNVSVIPIVAMGGMGKTLLARLVYNDPRVVNHFKDLRMWVYVSEKFDVKKLLNEILSQSTSHNVSDQLSMEQLQTKVGEALGDKKYLLVLDDVWNEDREKWLELEHRLRCGAVGSKIVVTTRSDIVASIVGTLQTYHLEKLSESDGLSLFKKLAFGDRQEQPNLVLIGEEIVKKCGGVPLAIKTLGSLMYSKESEREWELVRENDIWKLQGEDNRILAALRLSYDHLTPSLKECFAYCVIYPKGWVMDSGDLIKQWIAHGFIQSSEGNELLEEKGEEYFKTLCSRSFFQDVYKYDIGYEGTNCRMHDLVRDLAITIAGNEFAFSGRHNRTTTRHLYVEDVELKYVEAFENFDKMRSITILFSLNFVVSEANVCLRFRRLRVLDLSDSRINYLPKSIGKVKHLRYLDLSHTNIEELPETICNLFNLQTLKLWRTKIGKLPKGIRRMISLRHIELPGDESDVLMPNGIGELAFLRTLSDFIVGENSGCGIEVLKKLNLLTGHLSIKSLGNIKNPQCAREASLKEKKYLHSMKLSFDRFDRDADDTQDGIQENVIQYLEPHSRLKMIDIADYMGRKFPTWMEQINLIKLSLSNCHKCQHLPQLGRLSSLESLALGDMGAIECIVEFDSCYDKKSIFPSLKQLNIRNLPNLKGWSIVGADVVGPSERDDQLFPCLCSLHVDNCPNLTSFPKGLRALKDLEMKDVGCIKLDISSSLSLKKLRLSKIPNLEGLSSQQVAANDGQAKEVEARLSLPSLSSLVISRCPKLTHFPSLDLPSLGSFFMAEVGCSKLDISSPLSSEEVTISGKA